MAIARALVNDPNIIFADDPTGALDSVTSAEIVAVLEDLNRQGKTVIIMTRDLTVAKRCNRMITLSDGEMVEI